MGIKAIETHAFGYRFRSRLEARWATFFQESGLRWVYEPEGFELPGGHYLPDFLIEQRWFEIKPQGDPHREGERPEILGIQLASASGLPFYLIKGEPWPEGGAYHMDQISKFTGYALECCEFFSCRKCEGVSIVGADSWGEIGQHTCGEANEKWPLDPRGRVRAAFEAARGARFEYDERR